MAQVSDPLKASRVDNGSSEAKHKAGALFSSNWPIYRRQFITKKGNLVDTYHKISHSEGQGTAMLFAVAAHDRSTFDQVWGWTKANLQRADGLFSWRWEEGASPPITDSNNASDGDVMIAWALLRAYDVWREPRYLEESKKVEQAIIENLVVHVAGYTLLLPGSVHFKGDERVTLNLSYSILPAFQDLIRYEEHFNAQEWRKLYADTLRFVRMTGSETLPVPTDWMALDMAGKLELSPKHDPVTGYDAIRIPLYLAWCGHSEELNLFRLFWRKVGSKSESGGEADDGWQSAPSWFNLKTHEKADYRPEPGCLAIRSLAYPEGDSVLFQPYIIKDYFSSSLVMFSLMARSEGCAG